jgi:hypothetical protein
MTPGRLALDLWMAAVVLSVISIGLFAVIGAAVSLLTVIRARRRVRRPRDLGPLSRCYQVTELAAIDEALAQIMTEEWAVLPSQRSV